MKCGGEDVEVAPPAEPWLSSRAMALINAVLLLAALAAYGLECALESAGVGAARSDDLIFGEDTSTGRKGERKARRRS
ncbi:hypothetical protein KFE25_004728 [Diacronema lutheri]|uniref:Uncharacterized protein n=2 Tax=Diacronema lutheri TaxID=2081491 RepID=A0A8J5XJY5_DIALT|nr:hypothetical protein KFE25_004728 [Diacronema lutheri]